MLNGPAIDEGEDGAEDSTAAGLDRLKLDEETFEFLQCERANSFLFACRFQFSREIGTHTCIRSQMVPPRPSSTSGNHRASRLRPGAQTTRVYRNHRSLRCPARQVHFLIGARPRLLPVR